MSIEKINFPEILDNSLHDLVSDFYVPLLSNSIRYDRGVGYFSSGWLRKVSEGMVLFAANGGQARIVASPILDQDDWEALHTGHVAREDALLREVIARNIHDLSTTLEEDTLSALAWMIADEIITFKLAMPQNKLAGGDYHTKLGIFYDQDGNHLAFNGSPNESIRGTINAETITTFASWNTSALKPYIRGIISYFENLWANNNGNIRVFELPEAAREQILQLRTHSRPYPEPEWIKARRLKEKGEDYKVGPHIPSYLTLRDYQEDAISAWFDNDCCGLFEMATGTGKTKTALAAAVRLSEREDRIILLISSPFTHLVTQWADEVDEFGFRFLVIPGNHQSWQDVLANELLDFQAGYVDKFAILTTHDTFSNPQLWELLEQKQLPIMFIADEVHELGAEKRQLGLRESYLYRLGLSATPYRYFDDEGTNTLFSFFKGTVFEFSLADAIPEYLTPYNYYPHFVELSGDELQNYLEMTRKITRRAVMASSEDDEEILELYLILRQQIIINAAAKYSCLSDILKNLPDLKHTLVYCSPEQIDFAQEVLNTQKIIQHRFTFEESLAEREKLLASFASGQHQVLVAMKCLDQGVDVPATKNAIIMASTGNPKQFIQRRGRVLRNYPGKDKASIYDIIVVPTLSGNLDPETLTMERNILRKELRRYNEFASLALNSTHALNIIAPIKRKYRLREDDV